ncbi:MAG: hypothetical protein LBD50_03600 [Rickettsiales bacterium]|jgi:glycerol-3-phosphate cytidylyltransferase|nr:hypothetical protein [Rickettsiales bacterium]
MFHLALLKLARGNCDRLIAAVNSDAVVLRDKRRAAIINEADRMEIVGSIRYVDDVVLVGDNAVQIIQDLLGMGQKIDFYFRGNETKASVRVENSRIISMGVDVVLFPYTERVSTSMLRSSIQK